MDRKGASSKIVLAFWHLSFEKCVRFPVSALCDMKSCSHWISELKDRSSTVCSQSLFWHTLFHLRSLDCYLDPFISLAAAQLHLSYKPHISGGRSAKILNEINTEGIHQHQYQSHPTACVFEAAQVLMWGEVIGVIFQTEIVDETNTKALPTTIPKEYQQQYQRQGPSFDIHCWTCGRSTVIWILSALCNALVCEDPNLKANALCCTIIQVFWKVYF